MHVIEALDASAVRQWSAVASDVLAAHQGEIDDLNVFPVPDGDTGTNLVLTMRAAADGLAADDTDDVGGALQALGRSAVLAARGNSGVIVSQILCGLAEGVRAGERCDAEVMRRALRSAERRAFAAVADPQHGTILTVMAEAAAAADASAETASLGEVVAAAVRGAADALQRTPDQLAVLARAGVVDAGGRGLVLLLDSLAVVLTGRSVLPPSPPRALRSRRALEAVREDGSPAFGFEVQYLLEADESAAVVLRSELVRIGDSVAVVGTGDGHWNVHVHVNDVGAAIEAGIDAGRPRRVTVVRFADQITAAGPTAGPAGSAVTSLVAIAPGAGLDHLFEAEGVTVLQTGSGDVELALEVVRSTGGARVVLLPNTTAVGSIGETVAARARAEGIEAAVIPTRSPLQALAAVAVHDAQRRFEDDVIAMAEAAAATRFAEVRVVEREALTTVGVVHEGDVLGLIDGEVVQVGRSVGAVALAILDRLLGTGGELITVLLAPDSASDAGEALGRHISHVAPLTEVVVYQAGQPGCPLLIGME